MAQFNEDTRRVIRRAASNNESSLIQNFLSLGMSVDFTNPKYGWTLLHLAASSNKGDSHYGTMELLLKNGANVNAQTLQGNSPLHFVVKLAAIKTVKLFLDFNADVNLKNNQEENPLFSAVTDGNFKILPLLVRHGSDVNNSSSHEGFLSVLHKTSSDCDSAKIVKFLVKNGASTDALDIEGRTPLTYMLQRSNNYFSEQTVKKLSFLLKYSDVNSTDFSRNNVLSYPKPVILDRIILQHLAKLHALDLHVDRGILSIIANRSQYVEYFIKCIDELLLAKATRLEDSWVTYLNLLVDGKKSLKNYAGSEVLMSCFQKSDCLNSFPIYGAQMKKNVNKGIRRNKMFNRFSVLLSNCLPIFNSEHKVIRDVLDCLLGAKNLSKI